MTPLAPDQPRIVDVAGLDRTCQPNAEVLNALKKAVSEALAEHDAARRHADWWNNNMPIGRDGIDYKNAPPLPSWIAEAQEAIRNAEAG